MYRETFFVASEKNRKAKGSKRTKSCNFLQLAAGLPCCFCQAGVESTWKDSLRRMDGSFLGEPWEYGGLMGFNSGLLDYEWDIPSGKQT